MMEQPSDKDQRTLRTTLHALAQAGLTPEEIVQLRLAHLHLAGKKPNIQFAPAGESELKVVDLDMEAHRALVGWLVARPDSISDFLFPGRQADTLDIEQVRSLLAEAEAGESPKKRLAETTRLEPTPPPSGRAVSQDTMVSPSRPVRPPGPPEASPSRPVPPPPRSAPEMGVPPPGVRPAEPAEFQPPPPSVPEAEEAGIDIPLPAAIPKPPPPQARAVPPPQPARPPVAPAAPAAPAQPAMAASRFNLETGRGQTAAEAGEGESWFAARWMISSGVALLLACGLVCFGAGVMAWRSETGQNLLAGLGLVTSAPELAATEEAAPEVELAVSPLATPTLPPTATPTLAPPSDTPAPTETATPLPTDTPVPTDTPLPPTETPIPTETARPAPTNTPVPDEPEEAPTPAAPAVPAIKYEAPLLLSPDSGFGFIRGNTIVLRWQAVGDLAPDEQYAVRMRYRFNNETVYQGSNIKETEWTVPLSLFGQVDPPENLYEWFVVVERVNDDGSGTAISPESEKRTFTWK